MNEETDWRPEFSVGGYLHVPESGREAKNFNVGWRFIKGQAKGAETLDHNDSDWDVVSLPHGLEILPLNASGCSNYQGEAWYRKRFDVPDEMAGRRVVLHFEGLMGKSRFFVNGKLLKDHFGGFLPALVDITDAIEYGQENLVAVMVDNSDDPNYPPGKPQGVLDFTYFGGIYRDVWLITTDKVHITDPNEVDLVAGGGVFVHYRDVSKDAATVCVETHVSNASGEAKRVTVEISLTDQDGNEIATGQTGVDLEGGGDTTTTQELRITHPHLWHVDDPYLHDLEIRIREQEIVDAVRLRIGIRSIEFRGREGFFLNGEPVLGKLIGTNRHQDYAYVGNAVSNGAHWRDAVKFRQAGMRVVRCAHYPQDPAFMDACDALGMFVIITTPGWQFWNKEPVFEERVYADIRNMVRRDRNRPSAWLWEPILNETNYPDYFAKTVHDITHEEHPHPGCYTACDRSASGQEHFDVVYAHAFDWGALPPSTDENRETLRFDYDSEERCVFTREWGDCVDNWRAQSSPSRVPKGWGEQAQLVQAKHYGDPDYVFSSYEGLCSAPPQHVGGTLWHGTDHQRGYHADPFWGGILDATRQPKFSYQMFRSQLPPDASIPGIESGPFVYIAHIMHPTSTPDVTVFSNCDEVRLSVDGDVIGCLPTHPDGAHMPHLPVVFEDVWWHVRRKDRSLQAEGLINGEVAVTASRKAWDRQATISLEADLCGVPLQANGSDFVPVVARILDKDGTVVRLAQDTIRFSVSGPAELIGGDTEAINPQLMIWGEAVILVRAGTEAGCITVHAESAHPGLMKPEPGEIAFESVPSSEPLAFTELPMLRQESRAKETEKANRSYLDGELSEVEDQQEEWI